MKNKIHVRFKNKKINFDTVYSGHLESLRDILKIINGYSKIVATKIKDAVEFDENLRTVYLEYDFIFYNVFAVTTTEKNVSLERFKNVIEGFGFKIENMYLVEKEEKK